jgi:small subunit ribosomal protein S5
MTILKKKLDANQYNLKDQVVAINRVTKVVKGGKNMSFAALVVVGDAASGVVGYGSGKAKEVPQAIRKGIEAAKKNLVRINLTETTIPHQVLGRFGSGQVLLKPAPEGTGVIAGGAVRAVMTSVGVQNVLTKSLGSPNPHNVVKATFDALVQLRDKAEVAACAASPWRRCKPWRRPRMIRIQYYRSKNSTPAKHKAVVKGWALRGSTRSSSAWIRIHSRHGEGHSAPGSDSGELGIRDQLVQRSLASTNGTDH